MHIEPLEIPDVKLLTPVKHGDHRGYFSEVYNRRTLQDGGISVDFVQDNCSLSADAGTVRGLHFQAPPFAQAKLVRVLRGSIFDVAVDLRSGSPTYGQHVSATLSAEAWNQIWVPVGFGHGFMTLTPGTEVMYKVSAYYAPDHDHGLLWNDPALRIQWPTPESGPVLSDRDREHPTLSQLVSPFEYVES